MSNAVYYAASVMGYGKRWVRLIQVAPACGSWIEAHNLARCHPGLTIVRETHDTITLYQGY